MNDWLKKGEALFADGNFNEAEKCFHAILEEDPENCEAHNNLGVIAHRRHDHQKAADSFLRSLKKDPTKTDALINLCELLASSGNLAEALPLLESLAEKYPDNAEVAQLLSQACPTESTDLPPTDRFGPGNRIEETGAATGEIRTEPATRLELKRSSSSAQTEVAESVDTASTDPMALLKEGFQKFSAGALDEASTLFHQVTALDSRCKEAHNNLGVIAFQKHAYSEAAGHFSTALQLDPSYVDARKNLAAARGNAGLPASEATSSLEPAPMAKLTGARLAIINPFDNKFNDIYRSHFLSENEVRVVKPQTEKEIKDIVRWADLVWSTWCNEPLVYASTVKKSAKLVTHIRSYEILTPNLMQGVNWGNIDGAIFVAHHIRELANKAWMPQLKDVPQTTVYNCVELDKYPFYNNGPGKNIGYIGYLNHKKGIGLLLQCIREAVLYDPTFHFHIAGDFQEARFEVYMRHLLVEMDLTEHVTFLGWVKDVPEFLANMNYVISTSPWEGCPNNVIEAMACGIRPLVHNWNGARTLFSDTLVFNSVSGFLAMVTSNEYDAGLYRKTVETDFNADHNLKRIDSFLASVLNGDATAGQDMDSIVPRTAGLLREKGATHPVTVVPSAPVESKTWRFPEEVFSHDPDERRNVLCAEASKQISAGKSDLALTSLKRAALMSGYSDETVIKELVDLYRSTDDIPSIQNLLKRSAAAALEKDDLDNFLHRAYLSIHAETMFGRDPNYQYSVVDEDLNDYIRLAARNHPLAHWVKENRSWKEEYKPEKKLRVGFVLEGLSERQASVRNYYPLAELHDRDRFEICFYSRWFMGEDLAKQQGYQNTAENLQKWGCSVRTPERSLSPAEQVEFLTHSIVEDRIDILVFQTAYFVPQHNFVACLHPAPFQACLEAQQPEYSHEMDLVFTTRKQVPECYSKTAPFVIMTTRQEAAEVYDPDEFGIPNTAKILVTVHRGVRYNQPLFWTEMAKVLSRNPDVYLMAVGPTAEEVVSMEAILPQDPSVRDRIVWPGYRSDVMELLAMSDVYVDLFPSGGGSAVIEAMQAGLPIVCFDQDYGTLFSVKSVSLAPVYMDDSELVIPPGELEGFHRTLDKTISDEEWRKEIGLRMKQKASKYEPAKVAASFYDELVVGYEAKCNRQKRESNA